MDKLKNALAVLKKYHFWVLCGVVLVVALASWFLATGDLAKRYDGRTSTLNKLLEDMRNIIAQHPNHPNDDVNQQFKEETEELRDLVFATWEVLYKEQSAKNQLPKGLNENFKIAFKKLKPGEELAEEYRDHYQYFIDGHFPTLFDKIQVLRQKEPEEGEPGEGPGPREPGDFIRPVAQGGAEGFEYFEGEMGPHRGPGRGFGTPASDKELVGIVEWDEADRERLLDRFRWERRPTTLEVVLAQEDLWVYEALLRVIEQTNAGAEESRRFEAPVRRIDSLLIGRDAVAVWEKARGTVFKISGAFGAAPGAGPGAAAGPAAPMGEGGEMMGPGMGPGLGTAGGGLQEHRYVNKKGEPLAAGSDGNVPHPFSEFKMMPMQMSLYIAQKSIPTLLVHCANSNMPIEVKRLRINPELGETVDLSAGQQTPSGEGGAGAEMAGGGAYHTRPGGMRPGGVRPGGMRPGQGMRRTLGQSGPEDQERKYVNLEIQGIIYIYNNPEHTPFATGTASEPSGEAPPAGPAETPAEPAETPGEPTEPPGAGAEPPGGGAPAGAPAGPGAAPAAPAAGPAAAPPVAPPAGPPGAGPAPAARPAAGGGPVPARPPGGGVIAPPGGAPAGPGLGPAAAPPAAGPGPAPGQDPPPGT